MERDLREVIDNKLILISGLIFFFDEIYVTSSTFFNKRSNLIAYFCSFFKVFTDL